MPLACSQWLSSKKILHMSLFVCFQILSDFNADESCWSDSPGKLRASRLHTSRGCASCPVLLKTRSSAASCSTRPMNNHPSAPAAWDEAGVRVPDFQAKETHWAQRQGSKALARLGNRKLFKADFQSILLGVTRFCYVLAPAGEGKTGNNLPTKNTCMGSFINNNRTALARVGKSLGIPREQLEISSSQS